MVFVTAEIGINHNGDLKLAKKLIDVAKRHGCDAVKFQKRNIDKVYPKEFLDSHRDSPWGTTQRHQKSGLEFGKKEFDEIDRYCKEKKIEWYASAWDEDSVYFLRDYDLRYNKIASAIITNHPVAREIAKEGKTTFISTGLSTFDEIDECVNIFIEEKCPYVLLHCVGVYPCPTELLNLNMINTLKKRYGCDVGYSGHSSGIMDGVLAVVYGADYIEKHITLDRTMYGSDQAASLEERGLEKMMEYIKFAEDSAGDGKKTISIEEIKIKNKLRYWEDYE